MPTNLGTKTLGHAQGISIRVGPTLHNDIQKLREETGMKLSNLIRQLLEGSIDLLNEHKENPKREAILSKPLVYIDKLRGIDSTGRDGPMAPEEVKAQSAGDRIDMLEKSLATMSEQMSTLTEIVGSNRGDKS